MKKKSLFAFVAVGLWGLTACSNDKDFPQLEETREEVCFQVDVNSLQARASHADASTFDDFGISIVSASGNQNYDWNNVKVTASGTETSRTWTPAQSMYWKYGQQTIDVLAYTPFKANVANLAQNTKLPVSVSAQQGPEKYESDFLVYKEKGINPVTSDGKFNTLDVNFKHVMSQLNINLTFQGYSEAAISDVKRIKLGGTVLKGTCNFTKTKTLVAPTKDAAAVITVEKAGKTQQTVAYTAILVPQTVKSGNLSVSFSIDGWDYTWKSTETYTFEENTSYTLNITAKDSNTIAASIQSRAWGVNR